MLLGRGTHGLHPKRILDLYVSSPSSATRTLTPILQFIPCDIVSLILQGVGGALASTESQNNQSAAPGTNVMIAGLSFQVATLFVFMVLFMDFALRTYKRYQAMGEDAFDQNSAFKTLRQSTRFNGFLAALTLATVCIFWRSVYRVAELSEGWKGNLIKRQWLFVGFEGVMVIVACFALNVFNPAFTFKEGMEGLGGLGTKKWTKQQEKVNETGSGNASDVEGKRPEAV